MSDPGSRQRKHAIRTRNSCNLCRKMKIRCDRQGGKCSHCTARGISCEVTLVHPGKPKLTRGEYLTSIEGRVLRMEALLKSSGIANSSSTPIKKPSLFSEGQGLQTLNDKLSTLVIKDSGTHEYIGPSSGFALLSPKGLAWAKGKTGSNKLDGIAQQLKNHRPRWPAFDGRSWWPGKGFTGHALPSKEIVDIFVTHFFQTFNATFPLFDRNVFYGYFERHYSSDPPTNKSWYGALNVVLAIAFITAGDEIRLDPNFEKEEISPYVGFTEWSWKLFQNAAAEFSDIVFTDSDLMGVQTIIGLSFVLQAIANVEGAFVLIGTAARLAHAMGLHRWLEGFGLSRAELEQRRRVYWIIYVIENSMCLRIGRPSALNEEDLGLELPPQDLEFERGGMQIPSTGDLRYYPFRAMCSIALIEGKVYSELYSAKSQTIAPGEKLRSVGRLDRELQDWKDLIPTEFRPEHEIQGEYENSFPIVMLHFAYYNCLVAIHRVSVYHGSWTGKDDDLDSSRSPNPPPPELLETMGLNPRVYASYTLCLSAARTMIYLTVNYLGSASDPRNTLIWIAVYFPLSACLTIFAHILQSPLDPKSEFDLELIERTLEYIRRPSMAQENVTTFILFDVVGGLLEIAQEHIETSKNKDISMSSYAATGGETKGKEGALDALLAPPESSSNELPNPLLLTYPDSLLMTTPDLSQFDFSTFMNSDGFLLADEDSLYGWG